MRSAHPSISAVCLLLRREGFQPKHQPHLKACIPSMLLHPRFHRFGTPRLDSVNPLLGTRAARRGEKFVQPCWRIRPNRGCLDIVVPEGHREEIVSTPSLNTHRITHLALQLQFSLSHNSSLPLALCTQKLCDSFPLPFDIVGTSLTSIGAAAKEPYDVHQADVSNAENGTPTLMLSRKRRDEMGYYLAVLIQAMGSKEHGR